MDRTGGVPGEHIRLPEPAIVAGAVSMGLAAYPLLHR